MTCGQRQHVYDAVCNKTVINVATKHWNLYRARTAANDSRQEPGSSDIAWVWQIVNGSIGGGGAGRSGIDQTCYSWPFVAAAAVHISGKHIKAIGTE